MNKSIYFLKNDLYTDLIIRKEDDKNFENKLLSLGEDSSIFEYDELSMLSNLELDILDGENEKIKSSYIVDTIIKKDYDNVTNLLNELETEYLTNENNKVEYLPDETMIDFTDYLFVHLTSLLSNIRNDIDDEIVFKLEEIIDSIDINNFKSFLNKYNIDITASSYNDFVEVGFVKEFGINNDDKKIKIQFDTMIKK